MYSAFSKMKTRLSAFFCAQRKIRVVGVSQPRKKYHIFSAAATHDCCNMHAACNLLSVHLFIASFHSNDFLFPVLPTRREKCSRVFFLVPRQLVKAFFK
jgi:hypothetical protein